MLNKGKDIVGNKVKEEPKDYCKDCDPKLILCGCVGCGYSTGIVN